jgi:ribosomal protein S18 acetylase RimI-like enzyme
MAQWDPQKLRVRVMRHEDLDDLVEIDAKVFGKPRWEYYRGKLAAALDPSRTINTSLVATYDGKVVGFLMAELYHGEFGIPESSATIDTIGVDPEYQTRGIATHMAEELFSVLKGARVERVHTIVRWNDWQLMRFFAQRGFAPGQSLYLEKTVQ